ncbi:DEAD/DEAH box helicase family protein [Microcoleus sp. MOSTC5]
MLASSHLVRRSDRTKQLLDAQPWDLVILDEAHHARHQSPQNRKETPNRLLQLMQQLKEKSPYLLLLSATPMQINTSKFSIYCNFWDCEDIGLMVKISATILALGILTIKVAIML